MRTVTIWQVAGGPVGTIGPVLAGNLMGRMIPGVGQYLPAILAVIVVVSLIPPATERR